MKIKAILCDFDGSLADHNEKYSPNAKNLIAKALNKGVRFSIATGRQYLGKIKETIKDLGIDGHHIVHGGAMIYDTINNKKIWHKDISKNSLSVISEYLKKEDVIFAFETEYNIYMYPKHIETVYVKNVEVKNLNEYEGEEVYKLLVFAKLNGFAEPVMDVHIKKIQNLSKDVEIIKFNFDGAFGVDITSERSTKHTAVLEYCKILGYDRQEVAAIGDGYNDYPLLTAVGFKIAMGNSHKELKEIADLVVAPVYENGFDEAMEYMLDNLT